MSNLNDELNDLVAALIKAAIGESKLYMDSVKLDYGGFSENLKCTIQPKITVRINGDVSGELTLSGEAHKQVRRLFEQHRLVAELKQKDKDIQTMIAEQKDTLAALSAEKNTSTILRGKIAQLHKMSEPDG